MQYVISFLEGIITFISPCLLPMLPIYISYFAGGGERSTKKTLTGAIGFVVGFTVVCILMGALAGTVGSFLKEHQTAVNIISGIVVIFIGLNFLGVFKLNLFRGSNRSVDTSNMGKIGKMAHIMAAMAAEASEETKEAAAESQAEEAENTTEETM